MFTRILRSGSLKARVRWIMIFLLGTVVLSLIVSFHWQGYGSRPGPGGIAGVIFGHQIPWETFQQEYQLIRRNLEAQAGPVPATLEPFVRQQAWDRLILREEARQRVRISDQAVARHIHNQPIFQHEGWFSQDRYFRFVRSLGLSPQAFEERLRDDLRIQRLLDSVNAQVSVSEEELRTAYAKEYERLNAIVLVVEPSAFERQARQALTEEDVRRYYASHQEAVRRPAKRLIHYLGMSGGEAAVAQQRRLFTDEELRTYEETHEEEFTKDDGSVPPVEAVRDTILEHLSNAEARKDLKHLALDLDEDREAGGRFEEIALTRQLRTRSVGPIERGAPGILNGPTASMLDAAFGVRLGQMTQVFEGPQGVFVLMPVEDIPSRIPSFEEAVDEIAQLVVAERSRDAAKAHAQQLRDELLAQRTAGLTIDEASLRLGKSPLRPAPFTRHDPLGPLGNVPAVTEALFNMKPGELSTVLETPRGFVIGCVEERLPFDDAQFAKDKERFRETVLASKRNERTAMWLSSLRQRAHLKNFLDSKNSP